MEHGIEQHHRGDHSPAMAAMAPLPSGTVIGAEQSEIRVDGDLGPLGSEEDELAQSVAEMEVRRSCVLLSPGCPLIQPQDGPCYGPKSINSSYKY